MYIDALYKTTFSKKQFPGVPSCGLEKQNIQDKKVYWMRKQTNTLAS